MQGTRTLNDFESEIAYFVFVIFCSRQQFKMVKHNKAVKTAIFSEYFSQ